MDKKEKLGFIKRQFLRFMNKKNEIANNVAHEIKQFTYDNSQKLKHLFAGAVLLSSFSLSAQANSGNIADNDDVDVKRKISLTANNVKINTNILDSAYIANMADFSAAEIMKSVKTEETYNGHKLNLKTVRPETIVHLFEASGSQTIMDKKNIQDARYIGDFQFNLNNTIYELAKYCRKDFPQLAEAAGVDTKTGRIIKRNARTQQFYNTWCQLCNGKDSEKFSRMRFEFMFETHFKPTFTQLHNEHQDFPLITLDNYAEPENFLFSALVMGTATQSPKNAFKIINKQINIAKEEAKKTGKNITPLDIYKRVSNRKIQLWGFAKRYNAEKQIAADLTAYFEANAKVHALQNKPNQSQPEVMLANNTSAISLQQEPEQTISVTPAAVEYLDNTHKQNKPKKKNIIVAVNISPAIEDKIRRFANMSGNQSVTANTMQKDVPPTETPMIESSTETAVTMNDSISNQSNNKKIKIRKLIELKKMQVRTKVDAKKKSDKIISQKAPVYAYRKSNGMGNS